MEYYAHTPNANEKWHLLEKHLSAVAELSKKFGAKCNAHEIAYWIGLWHDLGKFHPQFQKYLINCSCRKFTKSPDHVSAGVVWAAQFQHLLSFIIDGHHDGLKSRRDYENAFFKYERNKDQYEKTFEIIRNDNRC